MVHIISMPPWGKVSAPPDHAKAGSADDRRHDETMVPKPFAERDDTQQDREQQPSFVNGWVQQHTTCRCKEYHDDGCRHAVQQAQASNAEAKPVPSPFHPSLGHDDATTPIRWTLQHHMT